MPDEDEQRPKGRPDYKVYRSRPKLSDRVRKPDIGALRKEREKKGGSTGPDGMRTYRSRSGLGGIVDRFKSRGGEGGGRPWWKWALIGAGVWILISYIAFAISAQIQKSKLSDETKSALTGGPDLLAGQNILLLGGDQRGEQVGNDEPGADQSAPPRADSIMVLHASLTSFRKLSIPRDTQADIPGFGTEKINGAFSITGKEKGDAALMIKTVSAFLGIDINHLVIIDFDGFVDFIDTLGGVKVTLPHRVCGSISGGKANGGVTLKLKRGEHTLESQKALALARIRKNECNPGETDIERAQRQQLILNGIKGRLTDPLRFPINFIKGPWIGWAAPKALISDMGGFTLPQVAIAAMFGGNSKPNVLKPTGASSAGNLIVPQSECNRAVEKLLGGPPDREPECSPEG
ncbi:MAG: LCP family protein [Solirubrobacterales bacterium]